MKTTPLWSVVFALAAAFLLPHNVRAQSDDLLNARESFDTLYDQGRYDEAEPHALEALALSETEFGPEHAYTVKSLNNLAMLYKNQARYTEAEPLYKRSLVRVSESPGQRLRKVRDSDFSKSRTVITESPGQLGGAI